MIRAELIHCSGCFDTAREATAAFIAGRSGRHCFCAESELLDELDVASRRHLLRDQDEDYADRCDDMACERYEANLGR